MNLRKAVFAGTWYPSQAVACKAEIEAYLSHDSDLSAAAQSWTGGIVPHAGWFYSGSIACNVIHRLKESQRPDVVVIFGMHLHPGSANHMMARGAWETPFGELPVAEDLAENLLEQFRFVEETNERFVQDNTIEVQLPFVKYLLDPVHILAIGVPPNTRSLEIGRAVGDWALDHGKRVKVIGSTDLTHYGSNYGFAPQGRAKGAVAWVRDQNDRQVIDAMLALEPERIINEGIEHQNACCSGAVAAAVEAAKRMGATKAQQVAYATSYDKSPGDSLVGYAGVVFF